MSTYKVKIHAEVSDGWFGFFDKQLDTVEFIEADTAKEAKEMIEREIRIRVDSDEARAYVTDVELQS